MKVLILLQAVAYAVNIEELLSFCEWILRFLLFLFVASEAVQSAEWFCWLNPLMLKRLNKKNI